MRGSGGLRITGGVWRGRRVPVPATARPTTERVREAVWGRWQSRVVGARMLELYAGSGAMSLEALSRGASYCMAVEESLAALRRLQARATDLGAPIETVRASLPDQFAVVARRLREPVDLVFLDPPYRTDISTRLLADVALVLAEDGRIAAEHASRRDFTVPNHLEVEDQRRYGETTVTYLRQP